MQHACRFALTLCIACLPLMAAHAFSIGAPANACTNQQVQNPHMLSSAGNGGFAISAIRSFYVPGKNTTITIANTGAATFEGVMLSAFDQSLALAGTWQSATGYQLACNSQTITQTAKTAKSTPATFVWTAPAAGSGAVAFNATIVQSLNTSFRISGAMLVEVDDDLFLSSFED
jgi:hypothetical protein